MEIKTKYNIGEKVWIVYPDKKEICLYSDKIIEIVIKENEIIYYCEHYSEEIKEDEIITIEDTKGLMLKIKILDFNNKKEEK